MNPQTVNLAASLNSLGEALSQIGEALQAFAERSAIAAENLPLEIDAPPAPTPTRRGRKPAAEAAPLERDEPAGPGPHDETPVEEISLETVRRALVATAEANPAAREKIRAWLEAEFKTANIGGIPAAHYPAILVGLENFRHG